MKRILIVGAGFSGAVFGRLAAEDGLHVDIIDMKDHIGGHSYSYQDAETKIEIQKYGPHIFHTIYEDVYAFITRFTKLNNFTNRVKAIHNDRVYSLPINLHTINQFYDKNFTPVEAEKFIESKTIKFDKIINFKEALLSSIGDELYEAFFHHYTIKQWGVEPENIVVSTAKRLPVRFNYNDNYFNDQYQGIPVDGYGKLFENILLHPNIKLTLETDFGLLKKNWKNDYDHLVFTGSIDDYYDYIYGALPYRTLRFEKITGKDIQGNAVINYPDASVPFTRIHEHKYFTPEKNFDQSIAFKEYSEATDSRNHPFYPVENKESIELYNKYLSLAQNEPDVLFLGRLAQFKYRNMDQVIKASIDAYNLFHQNH